jgi:hypothetical protein
MPSSALFEFTAHQKTVLGRSGALMTRRAEETEAKVSRCRCREPCRRCHIFPEVRPYCTQPR